MAGTHFTLPAALLLLVLTPSVDSATVGTTAATTQATVSTASTTQAPTTTPEAKHSDLHCEMQLFFDTEGQAYAAYDSKPGSTQADCEKLCFEDAKCKATTKKGADCQFYSSRSGKENVGSKMSKKFCYKESYLNRNCEMRDLKENKGQDYALHNKVSGSNLEACKLLCFKDHQCKSVEWKTSFCYLYKTNIGSPNSGSTLSQKSCQGEFDMPQHLSNSQSCQMRDFSDMKGMDYAESHKDDTGNNHEECKNRCFQDPKCQASEFKNSKCSFFRSTEGTYNKNSKLAKKLCGEEQSSSFNGNCQMKDFINNEGEAYAKYKSDSGNRLDDCKKRCFSDSMCKSTEFTSNTCMYYTTSTGSSKTQHTLSKKLCDPCNQPQYMGKRQCSGSVQRYYYNYKNSKCQMFIYGGCGGTDNNFVYMEECRNTCEQSQGSYSQENCEMKEQADTAGQDYAAYFTEDGANPEDCKKKCFQDSMCQSVEFRSSKCLYFSTNKGVHNTNVKLHVKSCGEDKAASTWNSQMPNDMTCRMQDEEGYKGADYAIYDSKDGIVSIDDCKKVCWKDPFCKATEFRGKCLFFNTAYKVAGINSDTLSRKVCEQDQSKKSLNYNNRFENCQMKENKESKGQDYASYNQDVGNNPEECKTRCFDDYDCQATELRGNKCWYFKTSQPSSNSGTNLYQKICNQENQNQKYQYMPQGIDCQMKDKQNTKGQDYSSYSRETGASMEVCKSRCFHDNECQATEYRGSKCWLFKSNQGTSNSGTTLSQKYCPQGQQSQGWQGDNQRDCQMKDKQNSKGKDYASYSQEAGSGLEDCKKRCFHENRCQATEFRNSKCWFFKTNQDASNSGTTLSQKFCSQGPQSRDNQMNSQRMSVTCQMKDKDNAQGQDYASYHQEDGSNLEACKSKCFDDYNCQATELRTGKCWFFKTRQDSAKSNSKLSQKFCQQDQQSQGHGNQHKPGNNPMNMPGITCQMKNKENSKGQDYAIYDRQAGANLEECKALCFKDSQCQATELRTSKCLLFSTNQDSSHSTSVLAQKFCYRQSLDSNQNRNSKRMCRMNDKQNTKGQDYASYSQVSGTNLDDCKSKCFNDYDCVATEYRSNERKCWLFKTNHGSVKSGSTLSQKDCDDDPQRGGQGKNNNMCSMKDRQNTQGQDYTAYGEQAGTNFADCKEKCFNDFECQACEFRQGRCWFFRSMQGNSKTGSTLSQKECNSQGGGPSLQNRMNPQRMCEMKDKQNSKGQDYASYNQQAGTNLLDCKTKCFNDFECKATEWRNSQCWFFKAYQGSTNQGSTLSQKYCHDEQSGSSSNNAKNNQWCQMKDKHNSKGQDYASYGIEIATNFDECKSRCFRDPECKATEFRQTACHYFKTGHDSVNVGSTLSQKYCNDGPQTNNRQQLLNAQRSKFLANHECAMKEEHDSQGHDYASYSNEQSANFQECKRKCFNDFECQATEFRSGSCYYFSTSISTKKKGSTLAAKTCWNRDEDERSENQSGGKDKLMCEMRDRLNMVGLSYASYNAESGRDFAECKSKCYKEAQCKSTEFKAGFCVFFKTNTGIQGTGSTLSQKHCWKEFPSWNNQQPQQSQTLRCEMKDEVNAKGQDYAIYRSEDGQNIGECRTKCFKENTCKATEHRSGQCYFFSNNMDSQSTGSTLSKKHCRRDNQDNRMSSRNYDTMNKKQEDVMCYMKDVINAQGQNYAIYNSFVKQDFDECRKACYRDQECQATEHRSGSCFFFNSNAESAKTGATLSQKWCDNDKRVANNFDIMNQNNVNNKCRMKDSFGSKGQDYSAYGVFAATNVDVCKRKCFKDNECQATELRASNCIFFRTSQETKSTGGMLSRKVCDRNEARNDKEDSQKNRVCRMQDYSDTEGQEYSAYSYIGAKKHFECKSSCFSDRQCKATEFKNNVCYMYATNVGTKKSGAMLSKKFCWDESNQQGMSQNNQGRDGQSGASSNQNCYMQEFMNTEGEEYSMYFATGTDFKDCKAKCYEDPNCKATEYKTNKCYFFRSGKGSYVDGHTLAKKMCNDERPATNNYDAPQYCTMKEFRDNKGEDYAMYNSKTATNLEQCKTQCFSDPRCKGTDFKQGKCYYYNTNRASYTAGGVFVRKFCNQDSNNYYQADSNKMCRMKDFRDTQGQEYASFNKFTAQGLDECRRNCYSDRQCQSTEFKNGNCFFYRTKAGSQNRGSTLSKKFCSDDQYDVQDSINKYMCQMTDAVNTKGQDYASYDQQSASNIEECRKRCFNDKHCKATEFRQGNCFMFSNNFGVASQGFTLSRKFCYKDPAASAASFDKMFDMFSGPVDSQTGRATLAKMWMMKQMLQAFFNKEGGQDNQCEWKEYQNYRGSSYYKMERGSNFETCKQMCTRDNMCKATDFRQGYCYLASNLQATFYLGAQYGQKKCKEQGSAATGDFDRVANMFDKFNNKLAGNQGQGQPSCSMSDVANAKGNDGNIYLTETGATFEVCKTRCKASQVCKATEFRSGFCLYFNSDGVSANQGSTLARKQCTGTAGNQAFMNQNNNNFGGNNQFGGNSFNNMPTNQPGFNNNQPGFNNNRFMPNQPSNNMQNTPSGGSQPPFNNNPQGFPNTPNGFPQNNGFQPGQPGFNQGNQAGNLNMPPNSQPGQNCQMKDVTNAMGQRRSVYRQDIRANSLEECKNACRRENQCKATELLNGICHLYTTNAMTPNNGSEVSRKVC